MGDVPLFESQHLPTTRMHSVATRFLVGIPPSNPADCVLVLHRLNAYYGRQVSWPAVKIVRRHPLFPIKAGCFSQGFFTHNPHSFVIRSLTPLMYLPLILFASLCPMAVLAANNWTEPCHAGECQWDLQSTHASGTMLLVSYVIGFRITAMLITAICPHVLSTGGV